jgi:TolA-binding protein
MAENLPEDDLLLKYLDGELSDGEAAALEQKLQEDAALQEKFDSLKVTTESVKLFGIQQQVAAVRRQWEQERAGDSKTGGRIVSMAKALRYGLLAAACIILVIVGVRYFWFSGVSSDQIYKELYVGYELDQSRSVNATATPVEKAWRQRNYEGVVKMAKINGQDKKELLLLGLSYLQLNQPYAAIPVFQNILQHGNSIYREDAEFYLGLAYLKNHNKVQALSILQKIESDPGHIYHNQVSEKVIREIKSSK